MDGSGTNSRLAPSGRRRAAAPGAASEWRSRRGAVELDAAAASTMPGRRSSGATSASLRFGHGRPSRSRDPPLSRSPAGPGGRMPHRSRQVPHPAVASGDDELGRRRVGREEPRRSARPRRRAVRRRLGEERSSCRAPGAGPSALRMPGTPPVVPASTTEASTPATKRVSTAARASRREDRALGAFGARQASRTAPDTAGAQPEAAATNLARSPCGRRRAPTALVIHGVSAGDVASRGGLPGRDHARPRDGRTIPGRPQG